MGHDVKDRKKRGREIAPNQFSLFYTRVLFPNTDSINGVQTVPFNEKTKSEKEKKTFFSSQK